MLDLFSSLAATVQAAEEIVAQLFCSLATAQHEGDRDFMLTLTTLRGRTIEAKLVNSIVSEFPHDLRVACGGLLNQMQNALAMVGIHFKDTKLPPTPADCLNHIRNRGGMGAMHLEFLSLRRQEIEQERIQKIADAEKGRQLRIEQEAERRRHMH